MGLAALWTGGRVIWDLTSLDPTREGTFQVHSHPSSHLGSFSELRLSFFKWGSPGGSPRTAGEALNLTFPRPPPPSILRTQRLLL